MVNIVCGFITFFISLVVLVCAFFFGAASDMSGVQVGLLMLVSLFGMFQGAFIMSYEGN